MKELTIEATVENLHTIQEFVEVALEEAECPMGVMMQVSIAVEEIYVNIANYAYHPETGCAIIGCGVESLSEEKMQVSIGFVDKGKPFNPLETEDADTSLSAEEREIGGLGIFIVKKSMDNVAYRYENGQNILTISKAFKPS